jgi:hypothetical protein
MTVHPPRSAHEQRAAESDARAAARQRWERVRAQGRTHFLWRNGVLGWGLPAAALTMLYKVVQEQGLTMDPALTPTLRNALVLIVLVFPVLGWLFGGWLWEREEARYAADTEARGREGARARGDGDRAGRR